MKENKSQETEKWNLGCDVTKDFILLKQILPIYLIFIYLFFLDLDEGV